MISVWRLQPPETKCAVEMVITGLLARRQLSPNFSEGELVMLHLAVVFLVIALIAAFFGFVGVAGLAWEGAKILFVIFIILAVLSFLGHGFRSRHYED